MATELAVMLVLRTRRPFFRSGPSATRLGASLAVALATRALLYGPAAPALDLVPLPVPVLLTLGALTGAYVLATELAKRRYYRYGRPDGPATAGRYSPGIDRKVGRT